MVFSSVIFLFLFLPAVLLVHFLLPARFRNLFLLLSSLFFYAWGEVQYTAVILASILINYGFGLYVGAATDKRTSMRRCTAAMVVNLGLLVWFKYTGFIVENLNAVGSWLSLQPITWDKAHLPLGISFFTFQGMSYVVDVHRRMVPAQRSIVDYAMYKAFFPQLIAGPIVRYIDVAAQIAKRTVTAPLFASGIRIFVVGLGKKVLLANPMGAACDRIFALPADELTGAVAWFGVVCFMLQLAFDFGGYSDMAVGLGRMFGFEFVQNFNYPHISKTLTEFWQRWHISLSTWFRDYLFNPLGGYRCSRNRAYLNLMAVYVLCGLWHGASWNFLLFGICSGGILIGERLLNMRKWRLIKGPFGHAYYAWIACFPALLFRAADLPQVGAFLKAMHGFGMAMPGAHFVSEYLSPELALVMAASLVAATPIAPWMGERLRHRPALRDTLAIVGLAGILVASTMKLAAQTHNPFIYFRF